MFFSIIIPIYNVEKYLNRCLESILSQCYEKYEVIMVSDKSSDESDKIASSYQKKYKKFKRLYCENTGLANAKNIGIKHAKGDYILFLDGDDFLEPGLLKTIANRADKEDDIIRFQVQEVRGDIVTKYNELEFNNLNGDEAFDKIVKYHFVEPSWAYCYKREFWNKYNFKFKNNCIAEDFGLTPFIIHKAKCVKSINFIGYNYFIRTESIMRDANYVKRIKKMDDIITQAEYLYKKNDDNCTSMYQFINDSMITYVTSLKYKDYRKYLKKLKKKFPLYKYIPKDSFKRKIKKLLIVISPFMFKKVFRGYYDKS